MGGVDLADQLKTTYQLDRRSKYRFYLRIFFDLIDIACVNSHIVFRKFTSDNIDLKNFKLSVAEGLIAQYSSRQRASSKSKATKRKFTSIPSSGEIAHLPTFGDRKRCARCAKAKQDRKTFVSCVTCSVPLCLLKERNCFQMFHNNL